MPPSKPISIPLDYHLHSNFSSDSQVTIPEICSAAIQRGIPEIGLSEHFDNHPREKASHDHFRPEAWWNEIEQVRKKMDGRLTVRAGLEAGEPHRFPNETSALVEKYPFDYIIGSLHYVGELFMFDQDYLTCHSKDEVLEHYFIELEEMTRHPIFDVLGHFDLPVRNAGHLWNGYDPSDYAEFIRPVLKHCIDHGIALDVNVAGLRKPAQNIMPDPKILVWYREMGGERVTLGSDAHAAEQVGLHLDQAVHAIQAAGLKWVTQFEQRQARLLPME